MNVSVDLAGIGLLMNNFVYTPTVDRHEIEVIQAEIDEEGLGDGDEIGVFTQDDLCAGAVVVGGNAPWSLAAWGDDAQTEEIDGFVDGEEFQFRLWDIDAQEEFPVRATYMHHNNTWRRNGRSTITLTTADVHFNWIETDYTHHLQVNAVDYFGEELSNMDEIAVITPQNTVAGGVRIEDDAPWEFDAYGDDPETQNLIEGFRVDDVIYFRIWDSAAEAEFLARAEWTAGPEVWQADAQSELNLTAIINNAPIWAPLDPVVGREGTEISFEVRAVDPDGDDLILNLTGIDLPEEVEFEVIGNGVGRLTWTPNYDQAGQYTARFAVFDGFSRSTRDVGIVVNNTNRAPVLADIGDRVINENQQFSLTLVATDPDGNDFAFSVLNAPEGSSLEDNLFRWRPTFEQAGVYENVVFRVTDFGQPNLSDEEAVTITVNNVNRPPVIAGVGPFEVSEGALLQFEVRASDPDGDEVQLSAEDLPGNATFGDAGGGVGRFEWRTDFESAGEYLPVFIANDNNDETRREVRIVVNNQNRRPVLEEIGNQTVILFGELELEIRATDPDEGDQERLVMVATNLPPRAAFNYAGNGEGTLTWSPQFENAGVYPNVIFSVTDPAGARAEESITMSAELEDDIDPQITNASPARNSVVFINRPQVTATVTDEGLGIGSIVFTFDEQVRDNFTFNRNNGQFAWTPQNNLSEGSHSYMIRAIDRLDNMATFSARFTVDAIPAVVTTVTLRYTLLERFRVRGTTEASVTLLLWSVDENMEPDQLLAETISSVTTPFGFLFPQINLNPGPNYLIITGHDRWGLDFEPILITRYRDNEAPVAVLESPVDFINDATPEIRATVEDAGVGVDVDNGIVLSLDGEPVVDFEFTRDEENQHAGIVTFTVEEDLEEGSHFVSIIASDLLGNTPDQPNILNFFVDTEDPTAEHAFLDDEYEEIRSHNPTLTILVQDNRPSSRIITENISLLFGDRELDVEDLDELDFFWDDIASAILYDFPDDALDHGEYQLVLDISDRAGNSFHAEGGFTVADVEDEDPPYLGNPDPPDGYVAGDGLGPNGLAPGQIVADTVSFVIGDLDLGVDWESVWLRVNDTTFEFEDLVVRGNRVMLPIWHGRDMQLAPVAMPGLDEGINDIEAFGEDNGGLGDGMEWQFFLDQTQPDQPILDQPDPMYTNRNRTTISGVTQGDGPQYPENILNNPTVFLYASGEMVGYVRSNYETEFELVDIGLHSGENEFVATVVDQGGNESEYSESIIVILDVTRPEIEDFDVVDGPHLVVRTPEFIASARDVGGEIDPEGITITVGEIDVPIEFNPDDGSITGTMEEELADGDYLAFLRVRDFAGNSVQDSAAFTVNADPMVAPEFTLQQYTSVDRIIMTGRGTYRTEVVVYANGEEIGDTLVNRDGTFNFAQTEVDLPPVSNIVLRSRNLARVLSDPTEPQQLILDEVSPRFSEVFPANGSRIEVQALNEVRVTVRDTTSGLDPQSFTFRLSSNRVDLANIDFQAIDNDSVYILVADVSGIDFVDEDVITFDASARDRSIPPNSRQRTWRFVSFVGDPPVVSIPDTSFNEDAQLTMNLSNFINDPDNAWWTLRVGAEIVTGEEFGEIDLESGILDIRGLTNAFGGMQIRVTATDSTDLSGVDTFAVDILAVNDAPVFDQVVDATAFVGRLFERRVTASDVDPDEELTFSDNTDLFDISEDGLISFEPVAEMRGVHQVDLYVTDSQGAVDSTSFQLVILLSNQLVEVLAPIADQEIDEDAQPGEFVDLDDVFFDPDGQRLSYSFEYISDDNPDGIWITFDQETFAATLYLLTDFFGEVQVIVTADDRAGSTASDTFNVVVNPINDPPRQIGALAETLELDEDPGRVDIADLDDVFEDVDNLEIDFSVEGDDNLGADIDNENVLFIDPAQDWSGEETITITVDDNVGAFGGPRRINIGNANASWVDLWGAPARRPNRDDQITRDIVITVHPVNDAPYVIQGIDDLVEQEDPGRTVIADLTQVFADVEDDQLVYDYVRDIPDELRMAIENNELVMTPDDNFNLPDPVEVTVTATDPSDSTVTESFMLSLNPVNDAPVVENPIPNQPVEGEFLEDEGPWDIIDLDDVFTDVDEGDVLEYRIEEGDIPAEMSSDIDNENFLTLDAIENFNGADLEVTVTADDGQGGRMAANFRVVRRIDDFAAARGPVRHVRSVNSAVEEHSAFRFDGSGSISRLPHRDDTVTDDFLITITAVNDDPIWSDVPAVDPVLEGDLIEFTVTADDVDLAFEGDDLTLTMTDDGGTGGAFVDNDDNTGTYTWQTNHDDSGDYTLTFRVTDTPGAFADVDVQVRVIDENLPPGVGNPADDVAFDEDEDERVVADLNIVFSDPDQEDVQLAFAVEDAVGLIERIENGELFLEPEDNWNGVTEVVFSATDRGGEVARDTIGVTVNSVNDLPTPFNLLSPSDDDSLAVPNRIRFTWEASVDVVEDSTMTYALAIQVEGEDTLRWYSNPNPLRTDLRLTREQLSIDPDMPTVIEWYVFAYDGVGMDSIRSDNTFSLWVAPLHIDEDDVLLPTELSLGPIYPNPFNDQVTVSFGLPVPGDVVLTIHDPMGRLVTRLEEANLNAGRYRTVWNGRDHYGEKVSSGLYICRLQTSSGNRFERIVLLR